MMMFWGIVLYAISFSTAGDPWGRPTHPRVVREAPQSIEDLFSDQGRFRIWWDQEDVSATIQIQGGSRWENIAEDVKPGWISPELPKNTTFRIWLDDAPRKSPALKADPWYSPMDLALLFGAANSALTAKMGMLSNGNGLWVATLTGGALEIQNNHFQYWTTWDGLPDNRVLSIVEDGENLWVGTAKGLVHIQNDQVMKVWDQELSHPYVQSLAQHNGHLYIGTFKGLDVLHNSEIQNLLPKWSVFSIAPQSNGSLWVGYEGITFIDENGQLSTQDWPGTVYDIELLENAMVLATSEKGVVQVSQEGSQTLTETSATDVLWFQNHLWTATSFGLRKDHEPMADIAESIWSIAGLNNQLWMTSSTGLWVLNTETFKTNQQALSHWRTDQNIHNIYTDEDSIWWNDSTHLCQHQNNETNCSTHSGLLYIGHWKGSPIQIDRSTITWNNSTYSLQNPKPEKVLDATIWMNQVWLSSEKGIARFDSNTSTFQNIYPEIVSKLIPGGNSLFGINATGELFEINNSSVSKIPTPSQQKVLSVASAGLTWCVGTDDGLFRYWKGRQNPWDDVLNNSDRNVSIQAVASDHNNGCWLAGEDGSIGRVDSEGAAIWLQLPEDDIPIIEKIIPIKNQAWILTSKGTWLVSLGEE